MADELIEYTATVAFVTPLHDGSEEFIQTELDIKVKAQSEGVVRLFLGRYIGGWAGGGHTFEIKSITK